MRVFGCPVYAHVRQGKLEPGALKCMFLDYPAGVKGYKFQCTNLRPPKVIISKDIVFNESEMFQNLVSSKQTIVKREGNDQKISFEVELPSSSTECDPRVGPEHVLDKDVPEPEEESEGDNNVRDYQLVRDKKKREIKLLKKYAYSSLIAFALTARQGIETNKPKTYSEAISSKDSEK